MRQRLYSSLGFISRSSYDHVRVGRLADRTCGRQNRAMNRETVGQGTLFGPTTPSRSAQRRVPPRQTIVTIVTVGTDAITAASAGRINGERATAEMIRAARPDVRNFAVDLGTIRWTDPKIGRRERCISPSAAGRRRMAQTQQQSCHQPPNRFRSRFRSDSRMGRARLLTNGVFCQK
jgi:hypothetical protein